MTSQTILILGGSYAGVSVAHYLLQHVVPQLQDRTTVTLVSASSEILCRPACPRAMISDDMFDQGKLFVSIAQVFDKYPKHLFRFVHGTATEWDHTARTVAVSSSTSSASTETISYHALVIATGATTTSPLLGLQGDSSSLKSGWAEFRAALPNAKSIVIAGGGPAGVETAGELGEYLNGRAGFFSSRLENPKVDITLVTASSKLLPILRPALATQAEAELAKVGVKVTTGVRVKDVVSEAGPEAAVDTNATITLDNGSELHADLFISATGMTPNTSFVADESLLAPDGRVQTNSSTLRVDGAGPRVYAVGDVASYARPAVHAILEAVPVICANIEKDLQGVVGEDRVFKEDKRETQLVPIGKSRGVGALMGYKVPSFFVWLIKGRDYWMWTTGGLWSGKQWAKKK
ncbi:hypothetical protein ANO11243_042140 [Dothideomycetidae sp. 11243]|nr:hypothetical protein ANO11243_042140 [fungal sp. No.11243]